MLSPLSDNNKINLDFPLQDFLQQSNFFHPPYAAFTRSSFCEIGINHTFIPAYAYRRRYNHLLCFRWENKSTIIARLTLSLVDFKFGNVKENDCIFPEEFLLATFIPSVCLPENSICLPVAQLSCDIF